MMTSASLGFRWVVHLLNFSFAVLDLLTFDLFVVPDVALLTFFDTLISCLPHHRSYGIAPPHHCGGLDYHPRL